ncbi:MAG: type II restriction endonuclease, partial [Acidobacteria bacterium]|nr:type II restriction endonuclease [Acidobacteriota bacterium]
MAARRPYLQHLKSGNDLVTPYEATRAGFVALALEKNKRATPFIAQARALKAAALAIKTPDNLLTSADLWPALLTAAGLSDKALAYLQEEDRFLAIRELIQTFLIPAGQDWVEELVYRFLLTRGDTLGGAMRNIGGALAQSKLTRALISSLTITGRDYQWLSSKTNLWIPMSDDDLDIEL